MGGSGDAVGSWVPSQPLPSGGETLPAPGLTSYLHKTTNSVQLQLCTLHCNGVFCSLKTVQCRALELCLFLSVGPRRGVAVWGNHSLSPAHTFSFFLSSKPPKVSSSHLPCLGKSGLAKCTFPLCVSPPTNLKHSSVFTALTHSSVCFPFGMQLNKSTLIHKTVAWNHTWELEMSKLKFK